MMQNSTHQIQPGIAQGRVIHHRFLPKVHRFEYQMSWFLLDIDQLHDWSRHSALLGYNQWSVYSLYDKDYIASGNQSIKQKLSQYLKSQHVELHTGRTFLFTHPRFMGFEFNSVSFYFCYEGPKLKYIVSEINNTPWGEKHLYLHDCSQKKPHSNENNYLFEFNKQFHISPFVDMDIQYFWRFEVNSEQLKVSMELREKNVKMLFVHLDTAITPIVDNHRNWVKLSKISQPIKMWLGIYWQAFRLWLKKIPFYSHPDKS